jgi:Uma2 family endonuclease
MATQLKQRMDVDEFGAMSEGDPRPMERIDGEVVVMNHPRWVHARLQSVLMGEFLAWERQAPGRAQAAAPTAVELTEHDHYGPDVVVARADAPLDERGYLAEAPLICVEIRSPSTWRYDFGRKKSVYEAEGVAEVWLVDDVADVVLVFRRSTPGQPAYDVALELGTTESLTSPLLPGFALALEGLFAAARR